MLESWKVGRLEGWKVERLEGLEDWKGRLEGQKEGWKVRRLEGSRVFVISPVSRHFQKILEGQNAGILSYFHQFLHNLTEPSAAGARRGVRSVPVRSVPSRRSHQALPAEGRPEPSLSKHLKGRSGPVLVTVLHISHFQTLLGLEIREKLSRNRKNNKKCL